MKSGHSHKSITVPSDWMCTICGYINFARRTSCYQVHIFLCFHCVYALHFSFLLKSLLSSFLLPLVVMSNIVQGSVLNHSLKDCLMFMNTISVSINKNK